MFNTRYLFGIQLGLLSVWVPHATLLHGDQAKLACVLHAQFFQKSHFDLATYVVWQPLNFGLYVPMQD